MPELPFKWSAAFVLNNARVNIKVESDTYNADPHVSFTGVFDGGAGQLDGRLREAAATVGARASEITAICDAWDALHLKTISKLNASQIALLASVEDLLWTANGERYGAPGDLEDIGEADFSNADDTIDSRDIIERIETLKGAFEAAGLDWEKLIPDAADYDAQGLEEDADAFTYAAELKTLTALESEGESYAGDWPHGATLIRESYFVTYAEELVKDIGDMPHETPGYIAIDWDQTAENIKVDYTEIDFDGVAYLVR